MLDRVLDRFCAWAFGLALRVAARAVRLAVAARDALRNHGWG